MKPVVGLMAYLIFWGHCHKNPPFIFGKPDEEYVSDFPEVDPEDWCGQWEERINVPSENAPRRDQID